MRTREIQSLLKKINKFRAATGLDELEDLPKGTPRSPSHCPIARAINHNANVSNYAYFYDEGHAQAFAAVFTPRLKARAAPISYAKWYVPVGRDIRKFIEEFDEQRVPSVRKYRV